METGASDARSERFAQWGVIAAGLSLVTLAVMYWLVLPTVLLGAAAVVLGVLARRRGGVAGRARDLATVAVCLGAAAIVFTPVVLQAASAGEEWGRDCALDPAHDSNCPEP